MSDIIERNIEGAQNLDRKIREEMLGTVNNDQFVKIDVTYPVMIEDDKPIDDKAIIAAKHSAYVDNIAKLQLTNSLFLGLGFEPPESHALTLEAARKMAEASNGAITVNLSAHEEDGIAYISFKVLHPAAEYTFLESDLWLGYLRAIHFLATRHDPDLTEAINRQLSAQAKLNDSAWLDAAAAPTAE